MKKLKVLGVAIMEFDLELYKAFLISNDVNELGGFDKVLSHNNANVFISQDYHYFKVEKNGVSAILIGYCFDIRNSEIKNEKVLKEILKLNKRNSWYDFMDYLNGRYSIIISKENQLYIYCDATNMKPVFYNNKHHLVASHEYIIKEILFKFYNEEVTDSSYVRKNAMDWTDTMGIYKLSPSVELEYHSFTMERIFPRDDRLTCSVEEAVNTMGPYLRETLKWLSSQSNKRFSLTGGVDSRVSLSVVKPLVNQMGFFTYLKKDEVIRSESMQNSYYNDQKVVADIVYNLNLKHKTFFIPTHAETKDSQYINTLKGTMSSQHSYQLSYYLDHSNEFKDAMHIKSTVQSIGKSSFPTELYDENNFENLLSGIKKWVPDELKMKSRYNQFYKEITEYLKRINLSVTETYGYHILDLIFLESRLGNFQSNITQETDKTMEVFNIFNSRKMIELLLSVPLKDRQNQNIVKQIINQYWPILEDFAVNDSPSLKDKYIYIQNAFKNSLYRKLFNRTLVILADVEGLNVYEEDKSIVVEAENLPLIPGREYKIKLLSYNNESKPIRLKSIYNNDKGREIVMVKINGIEMDIVDLYETYETKISPEKYFEIKFIVSKRKEKKSWLKATRLYIDL